MEEIFEYSSQWQKILQKVVPAVVAIKFCTPRSFDTERPGFGVATGFIVDKERGLILTNRHVVRPGPVVAEAMFLDHEEVPIHAVYRDPVHDFGFYRFNPKDVKFMQLEEIPLAPEEAKVGIEIRVVGNDAGEKLSILAGTLARLDRAAPTYGDDEYNDFNTFYYQAASSTSGGSSGSPVLNLAGKAVALNAAGKKEAASSFYLPLDRVARALKYLQQGEFHIPRGDIQTVFKHCPYDQVHRLGLRDETEAHVRKNLPKETGMLVVDQVIPKGPANGLLEPGDIVIQINKTLVTTFIDLESILDSSVGQHMVIDLERGGVPKECAIKVQDLHSIAPDTFLEFGGGILHVLSHQEAKNHRLPVGSVFVASEGYLLGRAGLRRGCIIKGIGQTETPNLESLEQAISILPSGTKIPFHYFSVYDRHQEKVAVVRLHRGWHPMIMWKRNDVTGKWDPRECAEPPKPDFVPKPASAIPLPLPNELGAEIMRSIVMVFFNVPYVVDGGFSDSYIGVGIIVDPEKGLIVVDKNTVPIALGDLTISFGASVELPGEVLYLHPIHNFAVIRYDPTLLLHEGKWKGANFCSEQLKPGEDVYLVGLTQAQQPICQLTTISKTEELFINESNPPRFRAYNEEVLHLDKAPSCVGAVLVNKKGEIQAIWASYSSSEKKNPSNPLEFYRGMPVHLLEDIVGPLKRGEQPKLRSLETEFWPLNLAEARNMGLPEDWVDKVIQTGKRQLLVVRRLVSNTDAAAKLKTGDLLIAVNNHVLTTFKEVEAMTQNEGDKPLELTVLRKQTILNVSVSTVSLDGRGTERIVFWAGGHFQNTHRAVAQLGIVSEGVYCSRWHYGSPAHKYGLRATWWVVEINGIPTPDLDTFLNVVKDFQDDAFVRVKLVGLQDKVNVITIKMDLTYYPTYTLTKVDSKKWEYKRIKPTTKETK